MISLLFAEDGARGGWGPWSALGGSVHDAQQCTDAHAYTNVQPGVEVLPCPAVHPDHVSVAGRRLQGAGASRASSRASGATLYPRELCARIAGNLDPKEPGMYAVVVNVSITDVEEAQRELRDQVVPMVTQVPGFVSGVWMEDGEGKGHSVVVLESKDAADAMAQQVRSASMSVAVADVSVHEVFAHA